MPAGNREQKFFNALRDVFVGANVQGESGYINLMRIKSRYYEKGVFPELSKDITATLKPFPQFREELFDKLYTFFCRYFSESGSIYFRYTPLHQNVYEKVYTNDKDVMLFWKTHMLYYVKTDRLFQNLEVELDGQKFFFDVSGLEHKKANEKRELIYALKEKRRDGAAVFTVAYSERGRMTKTDEILRELDRAGANVGEKLLERAFRVFERQSEVDYFINKNAKAFLEEQFNLWLYQYVFTGESVWTEQRVRQLQALKDIAFKIIAFISQFEDELVKIWNKPKFVRNSNYVITFSRIVQREGGMGVLEKLITHDNFKAQVAEWRELGIVDASFKKSDVLEKNGRGKQLADRWQHLPVDTKHFKDLLFEILGLFENLDESLDGWLINSENYQALNTILQKFRGRTQTCYIDPPFNTGTDFCYVDQFQDATWLTIMDNRLGLSQGLLREDASVFLHLDWNANFLGRLLLDSIFGQKCFMNEIVWRIGWVSGYKTQADAFVRNHDTLLFYAKTESGSFFQKEKAKISYKSFSKDTVAREISAIVKKWGLADVEVSNTKITFRDADETVYKLGLETKDGGYWMEDTWNCNEYEELHSNKIKRNAKEYTPNGAEITQKPEQLLRRIVELTTQPGSLVCDFFAGSATTLAVAHKTGRKWLGIEMGSYFETDCLYRMKHVLAGESNHEPCGISKKVGWKGGGFFKYYQFEQYEDALRRVKYEDADLFSDPSKDTYNQYIFRRDLKLLEALEVDLKKNKVKVDLNKLYDGIDVAETLSNLTGKWIKRVTTDEVEFADGEKINLKNLDYRLIKPLVWW